MKRNIAYGQSAFLGAEDPQKITDQTSTFQDNLSLPIHRWFRFSAGFSALWVRKVLQNERTEGRKRLFDPFAGSGTALLEGELAGFETIGTESHPFISRVAKAKLLWRENADHFLRHAKKVLSNAKSNTRMREHTELIRKCYEPETLTRLDSLFESWRTADDNSNRSELTWLALISIIRSCSPVGTAQWQYVLPKKTKSRVIDPFEAFLTKINLMYSDMCQQQKQGNLPSARLIMEDARCCPSVPKNWAELIITSPPYANNYDYADATRLEMSFLREIHGGGDLQDTVRKHLIRSCTQHVATIVDETNALLEQARLDPIREEIRNVCNLLEIEREKHGGKKPYHTMIAAYFSDMADVWTSLRRIARQDSLCCFVIGDSAPYGIYVPVEKWLGELAVAAGFRSYSFEKTRDRNIKWKNRKHRVPLKEGRLWVQG